MSMRTIKVQLPESLDRALAREARRCGRTKSAMIRRVLESFLKANGHQQDAVSAFEAGEGVWGSVEGPGDLSHNPKHLDGYGRP